MSNSVKIDHPSKLIPSTIYKDIKFKEKGQILNVDNSNNSYANNISGNEKEKKHFSLNKANNYVYLGSTNTSLLNNMGVTLEEDGSLLLIKGRSYDLFAGLYHKYLKGGFKYEGFNIVSKNRESIKFKEIYVDLDGFLIGRKRDNNSASEKDIFYKINFKKIEKEYDLESLKQENINSNFLVEYEEYIPKENEKHDLSSINNIVEKKEKNILKINREGMRIEIKLKDNQLFAKGLPTILESKWDEVDSEVKEYKIKLPLKGKDKILAIKPVLNKIQLVVDKGNKIKIYYLDPLNIFSIKDYQYEVTRLTQEPPLSFYSMVGENNFKNYHSGQPFSTQTIGNFSSRHIPFFSSLIDNSRVYIDKAKQQYALKKYNAMMLNIAKSVDPGFRGLFSNIKQLVNSSVSPYKNKNIALDGVKKNITKSYAVLNKVVKGINNGKTQGEVIYSVVKELKEKESITINHYNDMRAFFGINAFNLPKNIGVNAFLLASYAKTHSCTLSKAEEVKEETKEPEVIFSFVNKNNTDISAGLSAGIGAYNQRWGNDSINYGVITPAMASVILNINHEKQSNFSFKIALDDVAECIDKGLNITKDRLKYSSTLKENRDINASLGVELRSEASFDVGVSVGSNTEVTIPRNAIGANFIANILKLNININKFLDYGQLESDESKREVSLKLLDFSFELYRDLKFTPSSTSSTNEIQWYPLTTVKNFELMIQKKINALLGFSLFNSEELKSKEEIEKSNSNRKEIYKNILKINKLFDSYPNQHEVSKSIDKLDKVYLNLLSGKEFKNKLVLNKKERKDDYQTENTKNNANIINENPEIQQFLSDLKERKETLSSQTKSNMNEKFKPYVVSKYRLNEKSKKLYSDAKDKLNNLINEIKSNKEVKLDEIKEKLDQLYIECTQELKEVEYNLDSIDVMSISELADKEKSLPMVFVRLGSQKSIIHHQVKGEIKFKYDSSDNQLNKISTNYYF